MEKYTCNKKNERINLGYLSNSNTGKTKIFNKSNAKFTQKLFLISWGPIDDKEDENGFSNKLYLENLKNLIEEFNLKDRVFLHWVL